MGSRVSPDDRVVRGSLYTVKYLAGDVEPNLVTHSLLVLQQIN